MTHGHQGSRPTLPISIRSSPRRRTREWFATVALCTIVAASARGALAQPAAVGQEFQVVSGTLPADADVAIGTTESSSSSGRASVAGH